MTFVLRTADISAEHPLRGLADDHGIGYITGTGTSLAAEAADAKVFESEEEAREFSVAHELRPLLMMEVVAA